MASKAQMRWESVLDGKFRRLTFRNEMTAPDGTRSVFEGHAYYWASAKGTYRGTWFDSRGAVFPIQGKADQDVLESQWGTPQTEMGRTVYRLVDGKTLEVIDSVRGPGGAWEEFGRMTFTR